MAHMVNISIHELHNPIHAFIQIIQNLEKVSSSWPNVDILKLSVQLDDNSELELLRSYTRYEDNLLPIFCSLTTLFPGPLKLEYNDMSSCVVIGELFKQLANHYSRILLEDSALVLQNAEINNELSKHI
ncbi:hypothetical protein COEREDRAFT_87702 [Coemansia reversa NRRL 1564]|uniref:Uncharacterized protein n=1 Tax=Coemansia reversa (strain ATCC 12441 / NRRL 1564) TaxID=763665 RepID=A0A2G5B947_COERN|nr:hypothetical protein COEREDRAFT_87702 [Coemansia reversa NRRL 1564]|eukprot:PIA15510.1 hypothetical protein COEREDRAFT_87702 [Coemansia reversa NRRL 1564]